MNCVSWREAAVAASRKLNLVSGEDKDSLLLKLADETEKNMASILEANDLDLQKMDKSSPLYDRLQLSEKRLKDIA